MSSWNSSTLATSCKELTHWKRLWCWEGLGAGGEGDDRGWDGWMASPTWWTWVWVNSGSWWWTGRPGVLRFMASQSQTWLSDWTELNWTYQTKVRWSLSIRGEPRSRDGSINQKGIEDREFHNIRPHPTEYEFKPDLNSWRATCWVVHYFLQQPVPSTKWNWKSLSCVRLFATPWTIQSMEFSRPEYWSG